MLDIAHSDFSSPSEQNPRTRKVHPKRHGIQYQEHAMRDHRSGTELSFETLRMLSTGMTKAEVLSRAGSPRHTYKKARASAWVYSTTDKWLVELSFVGDRVIAVNWSRP
jgi:hypothetical protein